MTVFESRMKKSDRTCVLCQRAKVDYPRSESLCLWCRLGEETRARRGEPSRMSPSGRKPVEVIRGADGRRLCPDCRARPLVKKNPHGPGRYPSRCDECAA